MFYELTDMFLLNGICDTTFEKTEKLKKFEVALLGESNSSLQTSKGKSTLREEL